MKEWQKGWLAGLIDADGSFIMRKRKNTTTYIVTITIANSSTNLMYKLKEVIPTGKIYKLNKKRKPYHSDAYQFVIQRHNDIKNTINEIKDYLIIKKKKAEIIYDFLKIRENYKRKHKKDGTFLKSERSLKEDNLYSLFKTL